MPLVVLLGLSIAMTALSGVRLKSVKDSKAQAQETAEYEACLTILNEVWQEAGGRTTGGRNEAAEAVEALAAAPQTAQALEAAGCPPWMLADVSAGWVLAGDSEEATKWQKALDGVLLDSVP